MISHTFINNTKSDVRLIVVGEASQKGNQYFYPLHPQRNIEIGGALWQECPKHELGPHDGLPDLLRKADQVCSIPKS